MGKEQLEKQTGNAIKYKKKIMYKLNKKKKKRTNTKANLEAEVHKEKSDLEKFQMLK